ncbi:hypothetical protein [Erythrobacter sp.]|uniref:hypothetical protein n=1 Tax=Erythrobacter sp. TaxID=1042 RepID=UPI00311E84C0
MADNTITLELQVDADQVTKSLGYRFLDAGGASIYRDRGRCAGTYHFDKGDRIVTRVVVSAKAGETVEVAVTDLSLVSVSTLLPGKHDLSLFDAMSACQSIGQWGVPERHRKGDETLIVFTSSDVLTVASENGQWQMSGYLSLVVETAAGKTPRLFYFDPESTSGNGGDVPQ